MSSHHHPSPRSPYLVDPHRKRCPVCHQSVYSRGGVHPQCALKQADAPAAGADTPAPEAASEVAGLNQRP